MNKILLVVACALIDVDGRVLLAQRPKGKDYEGFWEFPGGKVNPQETPEQAIIRELNEELNINTAQNCLAPLNFASLNSGTVHLLLPLFICRRWSGTIQPMIGQELKWVAAKKLRSYKMPPADLNLIPSLIDILP